MDDVSNGDDAAGGSATTPSGETGDGSGPEFGSLVALVGVGTGIWSLSSSDGENGE